MFNLDYTKLNGLIPAIIQDDVTKNVLMLGFMNQEAYNKTVETGKVTFFHVQKTVFGQKAKKADISLTLFP